MATRPMVVTEDVVAYIDGFNLYYGMKYSGLRRYYWLDLVALARRLCEPHQRLVRVNYFTSRVSGGSPRDDLKRRADKDGNRLRQTAYLDALSTLPDLQVHEGQFLEKRSRCHACKAITMISEEKMTDVLIATQLMVDACRGEFDTALLVSGDTDLCPPVTSVVNVYSGRVIACFPPGRVNNRLRQCASGVRHIKPKDLAACQLSPTVMVGGFAVTKPKEWV